MTEPTKTTPLTRLEILLIISIACCCLLGIYLLMRPSQANATGLPAARKPAVDPRPTSKRITNIGEVGNLSESSDLSGITSYLPVDLRYLRLGLTMAEFKSLEPLLDYETFEGVRIQTTKRTACDGISEITAYFELTYPHLYNELIVVFASESRRDQSAAALLGKPNFGEEWLIPLRDEKAIHVWKAFKDKLVYKYLPRGISSVYDDLPTLEQMEELQNELERLKETIREQEAKE